jgi:cellulose synthase/poly-beta-1,6-N-acetylglucosamine synthase-like glycosyltransferase
MAIVAYHENGNSVTTFADEQRLLAILAPFTLERQGGENDPVNASQILNELGFSKPKIKQWLERAKANGSTLDQEILMEDYVDEDAFFAAMARKLRLPFQASIAPSSVHYRPQMERQLVTPRVLSIFPKRSHALMLMVPELGRLKALNEALNANPRLRTNLVVTTPRAMRDAVWCAGGQHRSHQAISALSETQPENSARNILHGKQGFIIGLGLGTLAVSLMTPSSNVLFAVHIFLSLFYLSANLLRLWSLLPRYNQSPSDVKDPDENTVFPIYSILVPLHHEHQVIPQLIGSLDALDWPRSRLDIKIICEEDDVLTLAALNNTALGREYEVVRVPASTPRTKPKALQYALGAARGQFLTVYDAEDRPHPKQLKEAFARFDADTKELACLQAPLVITNITQSWISALFAVEYSALFRRILPMLAANRFPLPLGGTSNHFKTAALRDVGGWDPFNVTEDADLGIRLSREGYQVGVIQRPTLEDAPTDINIWMKQRIRWYKGWAKTWLVMLRSPIKTARELGAIPFAASQLIIGGMLLSSLSHPFLLSYLIIATHAALISGFSTFEPFKLGLFALDTLNIIGSYIIFLLTARSAMRPLERVMLGTRWMLTPVYWLLLSIAAWYSLYELRKEPFRWNKTPHVPSASRS